MRTIHPPPRYYIDLKYYQGWQSTVAEMWRYFKPKPGAYRRKTHWDLIRHPKKMPGTSGQCTRASGLGTDETK